MSEEDNKDEETIRDTLKKAWAAKDTRLKILMSALNDIAERECKDPSEIAIEALEEVKGQDTE